MFENSLWNYFSLTVLVFGCLWFIYRYGRLAQVLEYKKESDEFKSTVKTLSAEIEKNVANMPESELDDELNSLRIHSSDNQYRIWSR